METLSNQQTYSEVEMTKPSKPKSSDCLQIQVQVYNLSKISGTTPFNIFPIPVYLKYDGFPPVDFPYAVMDPQGPIGVIGLEAIEFVLMDQEKEKRIFANSFVRKFESEIDIPIAYSSQLTEDRQVVKINLVPEDLKHVEYYDLWFTFIDANGATQYCMIDPQLQAAQGRN